MPRIKLAVIFTIVLHCAVVVGADLQPTDDGAESSQRADALLVSRFDVATNKTSYKLYTGKTLLDQWETFRKHVGLGSGVDVSFLPRAEEVVISALFRGSTVQRYQVVGGDLVSNDGVCAVVNPGAHFKEVLPQRTLALEGEWAALMAQLIGAPKKD